MKNSNSYTGSNPVRATKQTNRKMEDKIIELLRKNRIGEEKAVYLAHELLILLSDKRQSKQLKCECKRATFTRTVDEDFNPMCGKCGRTL